jgi:hypothetical protein
METSFDIVFNEEKYYYSNLGIDSPLTDLTALRKFYKEVKIS